MSAPWITFPQHHNPLPVRRFDPRKDGIYRWFDDLQGAIMLAMWEAGEPRTVKRLHRELARFHRPIAHNTVMTVMTRLWEIGMLDRVKASFSYTYRTRETYEEFEARQIAAILASLEIEVTA